MTRYRNVGLFIVLAAIWGSTFMVIKAGLGFSPPVLFTAPRYDVAGVVILAYALYATNSPPPRGRAGWAEVAIGAVFLAAAYHALLFIDGTDPTVASAAAVVTMSLSPVLTTGFARLLLPSERLAPLGVIGLFLGLIGVAVLLELDPNSLLAGGTVTKLLVFGATTVFALGSVLIRRVDSELPIETMEAWSMLLGAGLMRVASVDLGEHLGAVVLNAQSATALAYLSLAANTLDLLIYFDLLARLGFVEINLISYIAPVFAALSGWALLSEVPIPSTVGGFTLIFLGFVLLKRGAVRRELRYRFGDGARATD